jgi:hypothetical protein
VGWRAPRSVVTFEAIQRSLQLSNGVRPTTRTPT